MAIGGCIGTLTAGMTETKQPGEPGRTSGVRAWLDAVGRWLDGVLPAAPEPGAEPSRVTKLMIWQLRNRLPVNQGRPRGGGQAGFR
jgi:hypothetical protein